MDSYEPEASPRQAAAFLLKTSKMQGRFSVEDVLLGTRTLREVHARAVQVASKGGIKAPPARELHWAKRFIERVMTEALG